MDGYVQLIIPVVLVAASAAFVWWYVASLAGTPGVDVKSFLRTWRDRRRMAKLRTVDEHLAARRIPEAVGVLRRLFRLERSAGRGPVGTYSFQFKILERFVTISELRGVHLKQLALLEGLLLDRIELRKSHASVSAKMSRLRTSRSEAGKSTPEWARKLNFEPSLGEIEEKLAVNRRAALAMVDEVAAALADGNETPGLTYH